MVVVGDGEERESAVYDIWGPTVNKAWALDRGKRGYMANRKNGPMGVVPPNPDGSFAIPLMTGDLARTFVALSASGWSASAAVGYLCPEILIDRLEIVAAIWLSTPEVHHALAEANGGAWHELSEDERVSIALQQHRAQCARYLVTHRLEEAAGVELTKIAMAREVLERFVSGTLDVQDPLLKAMQGILGKVAAGTVPAQTVGLELDPAVPEEIL